MVDFTLNLILKISSRYQQRKTFLGKAIIQEFNLFISLDSCEGLQQYFGNNTHII